MENETANADTDEDAIALTIDEGARHIYALYADGVIGKAIALGRLAAFLDSKGVEDSALSALTAIRGWKR